MSSEWEAKLVSSNKEHELDLEWKPTDLNKDGQKVEIETEVKCQPIPNTWSGDVELKAGGFDLGPIKPWTTVSLHLISLLSDYLTCFNLAQIRN